MAPRVEIKRSGNVDRLVYNLGAFDFGRQFYRDAGNEVVRAIHRNIERQVQADGTPLKRNESVTNQRKRKHGRPLLALVDEHKRFINSKFSFKVDVTRKRAIIRPSLWKSGGKESLRNLVKWLGEKGYTGWFALDSDGATKIGEMVKKRVADILKKGRGR